MNTNINITFDLDFDVKDKIKFKIECIHTNEDNIRNDGHYFTSIEDDDYYNTKIYETQWKYLSHMGLLIPTISKVKKIKTFYIYMIYQGIIYKYEFIKNLDDINILKKKLNFNINVKNGPLINGKYKPIIMINNQGPIKTEYMYKNNIWSCFYCGSENAIDIEGTKEERCNII